MCLDDPVAATLTEHAECITYGTSENADYRIIDVAPGRSSVSFRVTGRPDTPLDVSLPLPGLHNARNATAVIAVAMEMGVPIEPVLHALARFGGVARRFEFRGTTNGVTFIDDYAHIPGEIIAALNAAGDGDWDRIVCVFQPHRYSRTATLWQSFADAFERADVIVLTDVYAGGEAPRPGISGALIVHAVLDAHPRARVVYLPRRSDVVAFLGDELRDGDLCLSLGAGDITALAGEVQSSWSRVRVPTPASDDNGGMTRDIGPSGGARE